MGAEGSKGLPPPAWAEQQQQPFATLRTKNTVQSHPIPTAGGAAGGGRVVFGQPSWSAPAPARLATNPRDETSSRAKEKKQKKKSFPTSDSIVVDLTVVEVIGLVSDGEDEYTPPEMSSSAVVVPAEDDVVAPQSNGAPEQVAGGHVVNLISGREDEYTPPQTFSSAVVDVSEEDASAPRQIGTPQQVVGGVEVEHQGDSGREGDHVGLLRSTTQLPLPDFAAYMANLNNVRKDASFQSVDANDHDGFYEHPFLKMSKAAIFRAKKAARRANEWAKVKKEQAEDHMAIPAMNALPRALPLAQSSQQIVPGTHVQAIAGPVCTLPPMPLLPGLSPAQAVTSTTSALSAHTPLTGLPSLWIQAVERARETARQARLSPMRHLAPPCIAPSPRPQDLPPVSFSGKILTMYTDGSWGHGDGSGGAGVAYQFKDIWYGRAIALGHIVDHHVAEMEGIRHAVRMAHSIVPQVRAKQLVILTDSETCLYVLSAKEGDGVRVPSMLQHINDAIQRDKATLGIEVKFWWVKGHAHIVGNERADLLASFGRNRAENGEAVGRVYDNPMADELDERTRLHERVKMKKKQDFILLGASSLPETSGWRHRAKLRAAAEEERSGTRLADRITRSNLRRAKKQLVRMAQARF